MDNLITRRDFFGVSIAALATSYLSCDNKRAVERPPNILVILTDQQNATMMSCAGNPYLRTPAMDGLASSGVRFERAYCTDPVCVPSRFSLMTGCMPSEIGLRSNKSAHIDIIPDHIKRQGVGHLFRRAGYDVAYGGKVHLPKMDVKDIGFDYICRDQRDELSSVCAGYIEQRRDRPFLLIASFINPHDICHMAIRDFAEAENNKRHSEQYTIEIATLDQALRLPGGVSLEEFYSEYCPPLPANFDPQQNEPEAIQWLLAQRPFRKHAREKWTEERWRMHRWAYCRLTEMVDSQIGKVLDAVHDSGKENNTLVIFTSDHGDMDSAHRMEHKTAFYEQACRVPLIMSWPGVIPAGQVNDLHLISNGLDLIPTLCDFAEIDIPEHLKGFSCRPLAERKEPASWRRFLAVESEIGHMIVTERHKYMVYDNGKNREQLVDLQNDPGEMRNAARDSEKANVLVQHRKMFRETFGNGRFTKRNP